jgi:hypothetical protein
MPYSRHEGSHAPTPLPSFCVHNAVIFDTIHAATNYLCPREIEEKFDKSFEFVLCKRIWFDDGLAPVALGGRFSVP